MEPLVIRGHLDSFAFNEGGKFLPGGDKEDFLSCWLETEQELGKLRGTLNSYLNPFDHTADPSGYKVSLAQEWQVEDAGLNALAVHMVESLIWELGTTDRYWSPPRWESW